MHNKSPHMVHTPSAWFIIMFIVIFFHPFLRIISGSYSALGILAICAKAATYNVPRKAYNPIIYIFLVLTSFQNQNIELHVKTFRGNVYKSCSQPHMNIAYDLSLVPNYNISLLAQFPMTLILIASSLSASSSLSFSILCILMSFLG